MFKIIKLYKTFLKLSKKYNRRADILEFLKLVLLKLKYRIKVEDFFTEHLYDNNISHSDYFNLLPIVNRNYWFVLNDFLPKKSHVWGIVHYFDFLLSKLLYPGLDGRDYFQYQFYDFSYEKRKTFVTEGYLKKINRFFNEGAEKEIEEEILTNKIKFNKKFSKYTNRAWCYLDDKTVEDFRFFCKDLKKVIAKPAEGMRGKNIFIYYLRNNEDADELYHRFHGKGYLIEEVICQADEIAEFNKSSVNTIRAISINNSGKVHIICCALRMGRKGSATDNFSDGGITADIDMDTGIIFSRAVSKKGESYFIHPDSGKQIIGFVIPNWEELKKSVISLHQKFNHLGYIAWDIAICKDYSISFIEGNTFGGMNTQQFPSLIGRKPVYDRYMWRE